jgi:hypothetical protein
MLRTFAIIALAAGAIGGFAWGFHHVHRHHQYERQAFEAHIADVCVQAAHRAMAPK